MSELEILRPRTLEEALALLPEAEPLAGGTAITPRRHQVRRLLDLRHLGLDRIEARDGILMLGAAATLQRVLEEAGGLPPALRRTLELEGGWNLRNMATLGGLIVSHDARSPLLAVLLAAGARLHLEPGRRQVAVEDFDPRAAEPLLITAVEIPLPKALAYHAVARAPADFPLVCAAAARLPGDGADQLRLALGGWGARPLLVFAGPAAQSGDSFIDDLAAKAGEAYRGAGDAYASAEYRGAMAAVLARRALAEVVE